MSDFNDAIERLVDRAKNDPEFRDQLMSDPAAVVENEIGIEVPADVTIRVVIAQPNEYYILIPPIEEEPEHPIPDIRPPRPGPMWPNPWSPTPGQ